MKYVLELSAGALLFYGLAPSLMATEAKQLTAIRLVGQSADVASSAYLYRADRRADANPPEAWVLLMQFARLPFEKPVDTGAPAVRKVLAGLLWEEVRPVRRVELSWPPEVKSRPNPDQLVVSYFDGADKNPHTWWNPAEIREAGPPEVSTDGRTYVYTIPGDTWGVVASVRGEQDASAYAAPTIRALVDDVWKKIDVEIEWGFDQDTKDLSYDGRVEAYDGVIGEVTPIAGDAGTIMTGPTAWTSAPAGNARRGVQTSLHYIGSSRWQRMHPDRAQREDVARSIVTVWTKSGNFSFRVSDLEQGPILAPEFGFFVRVTSKASNEAATEAPFSMASSSTSAREYQQELAGKGLKTIRQRVREHEEQSWDDAVAAMHPKQVLPPHPTPPLTPAMQIDLPDERMKAQWNLGAWHILRRSTQDAHGKWSFNDYPFGVLAGETAGILRALDFQGMHKEAADGLDQWLSLPMEPQATHGSQGLPDRPLGHFSDGKGAFTHAVGPDGVGGHMDGIHPLGPGMIMHAMHEHFLLTGDMEWLEAHAPRMKANAEWILRQRHLFAENIPGGERLWCSGLQPAMCGTTDANVMYTQFYQMEAYYYQAVKQMAELLTLVDPEEGAKMEIEATAYRKDILVALDRSIALTPVVPVRDGTYRSFVPLSPYARGLCASAWGWNRCQGHTGALYWDAGLVTTPLINPSGLLSINDRRVQGFLDVLEDRLLLENPKVHQRTAGFNAERDWFSHAGWHYQCGFERTPEVYLHADDIPNFLRSLFNQYAVDIQLGEYTFREHTVAGPPDKIFEESAFLDRFRHMLVMEDGETLWLARGTPRAWLKHGKKVGVKNAPSYFGPVSYEIMSDLDNGRICATVDMPLRRSPETVFLRFRHPLSASIRSVSVNGEVWTAFDAHNEVIRLENLNGKVTVVAHYDRAAAVPAMLASDVERANGDVRSGNESIEASSAQIWDLVRDFSLNENPSGAWSFGWYDSRAGAFTPYDLLWGTQEDSAIKGFFSPGWFGPVRAWCKTRVDAAEMINALPPPGELYYPDHWVEADFQEEEVIRQAAGLPSYPDPTGFVAKNLSDAPFGSWGYFWEPAMVLLMPPGSCGPQSQAVVRWTAPRAERLVVEAKFTGQRIQGDAGTRADVRVCHNGHEEFTGLIDGFVGQKLLEYDDAIGPTQQQSWNRILSVAKGDTIEFKAGTPSNFNYDVFGVQNKQLLPGVGLAARITALPDDQSLAKSWVAAKFDYNPQALAVGAIDNGARTVAPPFSFTYDGRRFADEWQSWELKRSTRSLDDHRKEHVLEFTEPRTGLVVRCVGVAYDNFPTIEWTLYFQNSGTSDTPILKDIQPLDLSIKRLVLGEFSVARIEGAQLLDTQLDPSSVRKLVDSFPYFNIAVPGGGLVVALSWSGQATLELKRDESNGLQLRGGQSLTHFKLHPGEKVRTPMIVLQFWSGDRVDSQNVWRRWMLAYNMPRPGGKQLGPQRAASGAYQFGNMVTATEENQNQLIDRYIEEKLKPDFLWMDAGWYRPNISSNGTQLWALTGTWEPDRRRFPHGLRAIADHAHARGVGTIVWCQPERASPGTELYVQHPEFLLGADGADKLFDFGNPAAWEWAVSKFSQLIVDEGIDIYRQDMNIGPASFWRANDAPDRQGITEIKHVTGYLAYLDELVKRNPNVRLDHFRVDLETLRRAAPLILGVDYDPAADQCHNYRVATWIPWHGLCSRVIDPYLFRSMMCPAIATGWDVRRKDLDYDLARRLVGEWEQIAPNYLGDFYPLTPYSFDDGVWMAWQFDRPESGEGIVQAFRRRESTQETATYRLRGLNADSCYTVTDFDTEQNRELSGQELMQDGLSVRIPAKPGAAVISYKQVK